MHAKRPKLIVPLYRFSELSEKAKGKVREQFAQEVETREIQEILRDHMEGQYPWMSGLQISFSLSYCQGDGVCVEGKLKSDLLREHLTQLAHLLEHLPKNVELYIPPTHHRYMVQGAVAVAEGCDCTQMEQLCTELTKLVKKADADLEALGYAFIEGCSSDEYITAHDEYWYTLEGARHRVEGDNHDSCSG